MPPQPTNMSRPIHLAHSCPTLRGPTTIAVKVYREQVLSASVRCSLPASLGVPQGLVLLCSTFAEGPNIRLELDADGDAWDVQHHQRFSRDRAALRRPAEERARPPVHYKRDDALGFLEEVYAVSGGTRGSAAGGSGQQA